MAAARRDPPVPEYRQSAQDGGSVVKAKSSRRLRKDAAREEDLWNPSEIVDATSFLIPLLINSLTEWAEWVGREFAGHGKQTRRKPARVTSSRAGKHRSG
jgi:hypothetical protein